jgi:hypothetical protein
MRERTEVAMVGNNEPEDGEGSQKKGQPAEEQMRIPPNLLHIWGKQQLYPGFSCPEETLPNKLKVLLCLLEGAERRQRVQAKLKPSDPRQRVKLDLPADVHWVPADEVPDARPDWSGNQRHFESVRKAIDFVTQRLTIADRANVWITTEDGNLTIEQIEKLQ